MIQAVADTHAVVWYLQGDKRLSKRARSVIDEATAVGAQIAVSTITVAELIYLIEKGRLVSTILERLLQSFDSDEVFVETPFDRAIALAMRSVPRVEVPDLPDRVIAATGFHLDVPVISRDRKIQSSSVDSIW